MYWYKKNAEIYKAKKNTYINSKSIFVVAITSCNNCCYTTWHKLKQNLNVCLWKGIPYCFYAQPKFVFWSCKTQIKSESLLHVGGHYHVERYHQGCLVGRKRFHFTDVPVSIEITLNSSQIGSALIRNCTPDRNSSCSATMSPQNVTMDAL